MTASITPLTELPAWKALEAHAAALGATTLKELFAEDPARGERLNVEFDGLYLDYSKHRITDETLKLFLQLAEEAGVRAHMEAMFTGEKINITEKRAVLHTALRAPADAVILVDGVNVVPEVHAVLDKMASFAESIRSGAWLGYTGKRIVEGMPSEAIDAFYSDRNEVPCENLPLAAPTWGR